MDVRTALRQAADENGWSLAKVASTADLSENAIRRFFDGSIASLKADAVLALMRGLPGFAERLGFAAAVAA
jgi:hypothetical protein